MPHVVLAELTRGVAQPVGVQVRRAVEQQPRGLDRVARHADQPRALSLLGTGRVRVDHAGDRAAVVVLAAQHHRLGAHLEVPGLLALGQVRHQRRPLGARAVALEAEALLDGGGTAVVGHRVLAVVRRGRPRVADALGPLEQHLGVVVRLVVGHAVGTGDADVLLGAVVVRLHLGQRDRPVEQGRAGDLPVHGPGPELVLLEPRAAARPVHRRAADALAVPRRQVREVVGEPVGALGLAQVEPRELQERGPLVVDVLLGLEALAGLEHDDVDALLRELVGEGSATGPGADDDDDRVVGVVERCRHQRAPCSVWPCSVWPCSVCTVACLSVSSLTTAPSRRSGASSSQSMSSKVSR